MAEIQKKIRLGEESEEALQQELGNLEKTVKRMEREELLIEPNWCVGFRLTGMVCRDTHPTGIFPVISIKSSSQEDIEMTQRILEWSLEQGRPIQTYLPSTPPLFWKHHPK